MDLAENIRTHDCDYGTNDQPDSNRPAEPGELTGGWLVLVAGPARSGKSSLARCIAGQLGGVLVGSAMPCGRVRSSSGCLPTALRGSAWVSDGSLKTRRDSVTSFWRPPPDTL
jgi:hypothetical protein